jgi:hypothetical protein
LPTDGDELTVIAAAIAGEHVDWPFMWDHQPLNEKKEAFEHYNISWTPLSTAYVKHWLDRLDGDRRPVELLPSVTPQKRMATHWFPRPYLAHSVESAIYDGKLEAALHRQVERIRSSFESHRARWIACMQELTAELIGQLNSDLTDSTDDHE